MEGKPCWLLVESQSLNKESVVGGEIGLKEGEISGGSGNPEIR